MNLEADCVADCGAWRRSDNISLLKSQANNIFLNRGKNAQNGSFCISHTFIIAEKNIAKYAHFRNQQVSQTNVFQSI